MIINGYKLDRKKLKVIGTWKKYKTRVEKSAESSSQKLKHS